MTEPIPCVWETLELGFVATPLLFDIHKTTKTNTRSNAVQAERLDIFMKPSRDQMFKCSSEKGSDQ